jgi:hypothetical protein
MLEDGSVSATRLIPILRDSNEAFTDFGADTPLQTGEAEGRFSKLMPRHKPSAEDCAKAKRTLVTGLASLEDSTDTLEIHVLGAGAGALQAACII